MKAFLARPVVMGWSPRRLLRRITRQAHSALDRLPDRGNVDVVGRIAAQKMCEGFGHSGEPAPGAGSLIANETRRQVRGGRLHLLGRERRLRHAGGDTKKLPTIRFGIFPSSPPW